VSTLYLLTEGNYSDYCAICVFSTRELAEEYKAWLTHPGDKGIEEIELDPQNIAKARAGFRLWSVRMNRQGDSKTADETDAEGAFYDGDTYTSFCNSVASWGGHCWDIRERVGRVRVWARSREHAAKIVNEWRTIMVGTGNWPEEDA